MKSATSNVALVAFIVGCLVMVVEGGRAQENKTVIGPANLELRDGADALREGRVDEGIRLTELGLQRARSARERQTGNSNLCAGYALREKYQEALAYCDKVLQQNDKHWRAHSNSALILVKLERFDEAQQHLLKAEAISPNSNTVQAVRKMYLDATNPVAPIVIIDDRRQPAEEAEEAEDSGNADES